MKRVKRSKQPDERNVNDPFTNLANDMIIEILMKLPPRSIARLRFGSEYVSSIILDKKFIQWYITRSSTQPRYLISLYRGGDMQMQHFQSLSQDHPYNQGMDQMLQQYGELVNHAGKITIAHQAYNRNVDLWVLEDANKEVWSNFFVVPPLSIDFFGRFRDLVFMGILGTGEMIFASRSSPPFFFVCFDPKSKKVRETAIHGIGRDSRHNIQIFFDHVETCMVLPKVC
ncbi:hypothetical protein YC2023_109615 [Brassica napus]